MKNKNIQNLLLAISLVLFLGGVFAGGVYAEPKEQNAGAAKATRTADVKAWDCAGCHKGKKVLPENHVATKDMPYEGCLVCHIPGEGNAGSLRTKVPCSHFHTLRGIQCVQCHGQVKKPEPVEMAQCVSCHGATAKLAEKTAKVKPQNPHESPHYGTEADCNLCHHQHAKSENFCSQCHKFDFVVP
jgi:Cytochrome c3